MAERTKGLLESVEAVLFDLDGTLVDSMWMWGDIDIEFLARYGHPFDPGLQRRIEGMSFTETAVYFKEAYGIPESIERIKEIWTEMSIEKYAHEVPLKPHVAELLSYLKARGIRMGIATSNGRAMADACLNALGIAPFFDTVVIGCDVAHGKPAPDIYLCAAERLGALPEHCLVFEDIPAGIRAGKAAGMRVAAVYDAFSEPLEAEKRALADAFVHDYAEFIEAERAFETEQRLSAAKPQAAEIRHS